MDTPILMALQAAVYESLILTTEDALQIIYAYNCDAVADLTNCKLNYWCQEIGTVSAGHVIICWNKHRTHLLIPPNLQAISSAVFWDVGVQVLQPKFFCSSRVPGNGWQVSRFPFPHRLHSIRALNDWKYSSDLESGLGVHQNRSLQLFWWCWQQMMGIPNDA